MNLCTALKSSTCSTHLILLLTSLTIWPSLIRLLTHPIPTNSKKSPKSPKINKTGLTCPSCLPPLFAMCECVLCFLVSLYQDLDANYKNIVPLVFYLQWLYALISIESGFLGFAIALQLQAREAMQPLTAGFIVTLS